MKLKNNFKEMELGFYLRPFDWRGFFRFNISFFKQVPYLEICVGPFAFEIGWTDDESVQKLSTSDQRNQT